jgi:hypothetical protein
MSIKALGHIPPNHYSNGTSEKDDWWFQCENKNNTKDPQSISS